MTQRSLRACGSCEAAFYIALRQNRRRQGRGSGWRHATETLAMLAFPLTLSQALTSGPLA